MAASPYIECDVYECFAQDCPPGARTFTQARELMRRNGWHRTKGTDRSGNPTGRDICPDCWKEGHR